MNKELRKFCVAPMMGCTTPYARYLYRMLSKKAYLFTEMIPSKTLIYSKKRDQMIENNNQNPIALQIGGSELKDLIECSKIAEKNNFNEINLNVGCPSKAVQKGAFGACLMKEKQLVRDCLKAMLDNCSIDVTMKCRIGIDNHSSYDFFSNFIGVASESGISIIYVHARNAILNKLSPKNNRNIPPLNYDFVRRIKIDFQNIQFIINGGINNLEQAYELTNQFDGVMVGRLVQSNPFCLSKIDSTFFNNTIKKQEYKNIITKYFQYIKPKIGQDPIFRLLSPLLYIFFGVPNSKVFKNKIHEKMKNCEIDNLEKIFLQFTG